MNGRISRWKAERSMSLPCVSSHSRASCLRERRRLRRGGRHRSRRSRGRHGAAMASLDVTSPLGSSAPESAPSATPTTMQRRELRRQLQDRTDPRPRLAHPLRTRARRRRVRRLVQQRASPHLTRRPPADRVRTTPREAIGSGNEPSDQSRKPIKTVSAKPGMAHIRRVGEGEGAAREGGRVLLGEGRSSDSSSFRRTRE